MTLVVLRVESIPDHLRGYLERFLGEVRTGLFVGQASAKVADELFETATTHAPDGDVVMVRADDSPLGYAVRARTDGGWHEVDLGGVRLFGRVTESFDASEGVRKLPPTTVFPQVR